MLKLKLDSLLNKLTNILEVFTYDKITKGHFISFKMNTFSSKSYKTIKISLSSN